MKLSMVALMMAIPLPIMLAAAPSPTTVVKARPTMPKADTSIVCLGVNDGGCCAMTDGGSAESLAIWNYGDAGTLTCRVGSGAFGVLVPNSGYPLAIDVGATVACYAPVPQTEGTGCTTVVRAWGP